MKRARNGIPLAMIALAALAAPAVARANFVRPDCITEPVVTLAVAQVVELVLSTVLQNGVGVVLIAATAVVSVPWLVAGVAIAFVYVPRRFKDGW